MAHESPKRIRNVALVGHRGSGKTSVNEALLFEAGAINRLGSVADGTTVSDSASDEKAREMSISASLSSFRWDDRKINLIDTPGEPSFAADALAALRVVEGAVFVVNMLDRERSDFFRTLDSLKGAFGPHVVATEIPIGKEHELQGVIDLIDMKAYRYDGAARDNCQEIEIPEDLRATADEYREKLMDEVAEVSEALMERYLEGEEISHEETVSALKQGVTEGHLFPVTCGAATRNLGINRLLDAFVEDLPSPAKRGEVELDEVALEPDESKDTVAFVFKTLADPYAGRVNLFRVYQGVLKHDSQVHNCRAHVKERIGQLLVPQGKDSEHADEFGPGDIGAVAKLKETHAGDVLASKDMECPLKLPAMPRPVMAFAIEAKAKGDEEKMGQALRRLQEEDPTIDFHRDDQTGEQILAGITQIHVEVIVDRMKERFGAEVELHAPHVPYREAIKGTAKAHARYKKQTGGRGQFADCHIEIAPGADGQHHSVDSSEMAFKIAGSMAFKDAMENAQPTLMEPIMTVTVVVPEEYVGDVIGDLNSRRGRPLGMEPKGAVTEIKAEVPMAEMLEYAPDLRAITGGQGEYSMDLARYEEVPGHVAQQVVRQAQEEKEAVKA